MIHGTKLGPTSATTYVSRLTSVICPQPVKVNPARNGLAGVISPVPLDLVIAGQEVAADINRGGARIRYFQPIGVFGIMRAKI